MKKNLLLAGVAGLLFAQNAQAENSLNIKPVVGIDYLYSQIDFSDGMNEFVKDKLNSIGLSAGLKLNKNFGLEAFYQQSGKADKTSDVIIDGLSDDIYSLETSLKYKAYGLDAIGYLPVHQNLDLIGTAGIAYYDAELTIKLAGEKLKESEKKIGYRLGMGVQYNLDEQVSFRLLGRYNYTNIDDAKHLLDLTAGIRCYF